MKTMALRNRLMFFSLCVIITLPMQLNTARIESKISRSNFETTKLPSLSNLLKNNQETSLFTSPNENQRTQIRQRRDATKKCWNFSCKKHAKKITYPVKKDARDFCYCDNFCQVMQDCCYDYDSYNKTNELSASEVNSTWSCMKFGENLPVWMKVNCSKTWTKSDIATRCHNAPQTLNSSTYTDFIPVVGADNITYRNQFCAVCNNQNEFDFWDLDINVYPTGVSTVSELMDFLVGYYGKAVNGIVVAKEKWHPRRYCLEPVSTCVNGHEDIEVVNECLFGKVGIVQDSNYVQYKNKACALCNKTSEKVKCGPQFKGTAGGFIPAFGNYDFYITINFRNPKTTRFTASSSCGQNAVFDNHLKTCVKSSELVSPEKSPLDKYRIAIWLKTKIKLPESNLTYHIAKFISDISATNIHNPTNTKLTANKVPSTYLLRFEVDLTFIQTVELSKNVSTSSGAYSIKKFTQPFSGVFYIPFGMEIIKVVKTAYRRLACFGLKIYNPSEYVEIEGKVFVNKTGKYYSREEYFKSSSGNGVIKICEQQLPNECYGRYKEYNRSEFQVIQDNLSLYHTKEKVMYSYNEYSVKSDSIFICHEVSNPTAGDGIRGFITFIAMSLSVISLFSVLITYSTFSQLRTPPGKKPDEFSIGFINFRYFMADTGVVHKSAPAVHHNGVRPTILHFSLINKHGQNRA